MQRDFVRLVANAGVLFCIDGVKFLVDALHCNKTERFSCVDEPLLAEIVEGKGDFADVDYMLATHGHCDHYDAGWAQKYIDKHPETKVLTPMALVGGSVFLLTEQEQHFEFEGVRIVCRRLLHDGDEYADVVNYGFVVEAGDRNFMLFGDSTFDGDSIKKLIGGAHIDIAFLNFPFVTLVRGKQLVREVIRPDKAVVFHLPFVEDDANGYIKTTLHITKKDEGTMPPSVVLFERNQEAELI